MEKEGGGEKRIYPYEKKALLNGHCRDRQVSIDYDDENGDDLKILGGRLV